MKNKRLKELMRLVRGEIDDDAEITILYVGDEEVFSWRDENGYGCPEDMTWDRSISYVFWEGFALGVRLADENKK